MIPLLGAAGGAGLLLLLSPIVWPRRATSATAAPPWATVIEDRLARAGFPRMAPGVFVVMSVVIAAAEIGRAHV